MSTKEEKWYDNIPENGILCWVNNLKCFDDPYEPHLAIVIGYDEFSELPFKTAEKSYRFAKPATKEHLPITLEKLRGDE